MSDLPQLTGRLPPRLPLCPGCRRHVYEHEDTCPHCGTAELVRRLGEQAEAQQQALSSQEELQALLAKAMSAT